MRKRIILIIILFSFFNNLGKSQSIQAGEINGSHISYIPISSTDSQVFDNCYHNTIPNKYDDICETISNFDEAMERNSYDYLWINSNGWTISHIPIIKTTEAASGDNMVFYAPIYNGPPPPSVDISRGTINGMEILTCGGSPNALIDSIPSNSWQKHLPLESGESIAARAFKDDISTLDINKIIIVTCKSDLKAINLTVNKPVSNTTSTEVILDKPIFSGLKIYSYNSNQIIEQLYENNTLEFDFSVDLDIKFNDHIDFRTFYIELTIDSSVTQQLDFTHGKNFTSIDIATGNNKDCNIEQSHVLDCTVKSLGFEIGGPRDPNNLSMWINDCGRKTKKSIYGVLSFTNDGDFQVNNSIVASIPLPREINFANDVIGFSFDARVDGMSFDQFTGTNDNLTWKFKPKGADPGFFPASHDFHPEGKIIFSFKIEEDDMSEFRDAKWNAFITFDRQSAMKTDLINIKKEDCVELKFKRNRCCSCKKPLRKRLKFRSKGMKSKN